jgi:hypothetical protein
MVCIIVKREGCISKCLQNPHKATSNEHEERVFVDDVRRLL